MSSHAFWYATRGTGVAALVLLTLVVALGVAGSLRLRSDRWPRFLVVGLHRNLTLLTLAFLAGHIATTVLDSYTPIALRDAVIPFAGRYRPLWLGLGAVAVDLLLALTVTSLLRARVGYRTWRALHWLAYAAWPVALVHGLGTGSDARFAWMQALSLLSVLTVLAALAFRLSRSGAAPARRALAGGVAVLAVVVGGAWYRSGPAAHGWAARAGTPKALLPHTRVVAAPPLAKPLAHRVVDLPRAPFATHLSGTLRTATAPSGVVTVDIRGRTTGAARGLLWIRLRGEPVDDGGVAMTASGVRLGPPAAPNLYVGSVRALAGSELRLGVHDASGRHLLLDVTLQIDEVAGTVSGSIRAATP
jgi:DMSO/TMAO reductase YedYZ heme-binding membrane subunit